MHRKRFSHFGLFSVAEAWILKRKLAATSSMILEECRMGWDLTINTLFAISMEGSWQSFGTVGCSEPTSIKPAPPVAGGAAAKLMAMAKSYLAYLLLKQSVA